MNQQLPLWGSDRYCNPVTFSDGMVHTNPDPYILRWCGRYYCYATDEHGVNVSISEDLVHWEYKGYAIEDDTYHYYWAPSVIYLNGVFYMYYSNVRSDEEDCHQQHLKLAKSASPLGPFVWEKTFFDHFSIDSHPFLWNGNLYMFYSVNDWMGTEGKVAGTCILLDAMISPEEFAGRPRPVVLPSLEKEIYEKNRFGDGRDWYTIEGACPVCRDKNVWLLYSANAYEHEDYFVGTAVAEAGEKLTDMRWKKYPDAYTWCPLLVKNQNVEGTGHNTVTKAPNMADDWIVYHGRDAREELIVGQEQRVMRIDPLFYSGSHMICFGPTAKDSMVPSKPEIQFFDREIGSATWFGASPSVFLMECWIEGRRSHTGVRYGIYVDYRDENNYIEVCLYSGRRSLQLWDRVDGAATLIGEQELPESFDYTVPHLFRIQRTFNHYSVVLDDIMELTADTDCGYQAPDRQQKEENAKIGVVPYFSQIVVRSLTLTEHAVLTGKQLKRLGQFYELSYCIADQSGLNFENKNAVLSEKTAEDNYREEIGFERNGEGCGLEISRGEGTLAAAQDICRPFSLYHMAVKGREWFIVDGMITPVTEKEGGQLRMLLKGLRIVSYRYTKIKI